MDTLFADVVVPLAVPMRYTYRVPADWNDEIIPGQRVLVQFGKSKLYTGIVYALHTQAPRAYTAKYLEAILDEDPVVTALQLKFWDWMAFYYCATPGEVMNAALPAGLKLSSQSKVQLNPAFSLEEATDTHFTAKELQLLDALQQNQNLAVEGLGTLLGLRGPQALVNRLLKKGAVQIVEEVKEKYKAKRIRVLRFTEAYRSEEKIKALLGELEKQAFRQAECVLRFLQQLKTVSARTNTEQAYREWINLSESGSGHDSQSWKALLKKGIFEEDWVEVDRLHYNKAAQVIKSLSDAQEKALADIRAHFAENRITLLKGVTGSGKTEIYIHLIQEHLQRGEQVLYLLPEIALTSQLINRLSAVFGERVGVYHSRFSESERVEIWNKVLNFSEASGQNAGHPNCQVVIGARSALFLPYRKLGLVIVDEEHDASFKQHNPAPRYQGRDSALYLAGLHQAKVLLGSATPSAESWYLCREGKYALVELPEQFVKGGGTDVLLCDLKYYQQSNQMKGGFSPPMFSAINEALEKKEQVILFQNRRGFAPYTECRDCAHVPGCVQCDVSLIYHKQQQKLICHYCGYSQLPPSTCPACGGKHLQFKGLGTEKIEEEVELLFPQAKVSRMDLDSTRSKYAYRQIIDDFEAGKTDILIGTQMVTKGLDFRRVQVVGLLNADSLLHFPDFRSFERAYQLITQVRGRAGRDKTRGKVIIQSSNPDHPVLKWVRDGHYEETMQHILQERHTFHYPPYTRLTEVQVIAADQNELNHLAQHLHGLLQPHFGKDLLGPEFPLVPRIRNYYHKSLLIKTPRQGKAADLRRIIHEAAESLHAAHRNWKYRLSINVDPN